MYPKQKHLRKEEIKLIHLTMITKPVEEIAKSILKMHMIEKRKGWKEVNQKRVVNRINIKFKEEEYGLVGST
ncbi:MAG TPA: hypothetical protein P5123_13170 [Spirochaetota bacterium]|nr:hypothetical protein [Spirochaetota bacterium]